VAGLRGEFASGDGGAFAAILRGDRYRFSPSLSWYPTEFSKFRLQYNYDHRQGIGRDHSVWMQFEFLLGAHAAHKF
jgi:outer membrane receptor protein involved in Fe transport